MALNQIFIHYTKKLENFRSRNARDKIINWQNLIYLFSFVAFFSIFILVANLINQKNERENQSLNSIVKSEEFSSLSSYFISKINSPYKEVEYIIQNNDSIEGILKKFDINANDIQVIANNLKKEKLTNIYAGRSLSLVLKKLEDGSNTVVNIVYPINNTLNIEVRKSQNDFIVKKNILKLYKKEVVVKNEIRNNLYSAATEVGLEPNIIIEFARIFGFEVDFQRDIRKGDRFEVLYERFEDDNNIVQDTGKIIYASMFVNGEENMEFENYHMKDGDKIEIRYE